MEILANKLIMILYNEYKLSNEAKPSKYSLFLDDVRIPSRVTWVKLPPRDWVVVRNYNEFVECIERYGVPTECAFDHDLCSEHYNEFTAAHDERLPDYGVIRYNQFKEKTGYDAAKWLTNYCVDNGTPLPIYYIHTLNPVGYQNIQSEMERFQNQIELRIKTPNDRAT